MGKIGIMGGTFDPIHVGHLLLAQCALEEAGLDEVWFVPTGYSYMKEGQKISSPEERFHMTQLALKGLERMKCLDLEIRREGATYSYETLEMLREQYPQHAFYFILGADCLLTLDSWRYPERIFASAHIIAAVRNGTPLAQMEKKRESLEADYGAGITLLPFWNLEISSTDIRERTAAGKSIRYLVPESVRLYIEEKRLYRDEK